MRVRRSRFRALVGSVGHVPAEICGDAEPPLRPGDHSLVTITMTDHDAGTFFSAGRRFRLRCGGVVGDGVILRMVCTDYTSS